MKLQRNEKASVDEFVHSSSYGLNHEEQKDSLSLLSNEVLSAFQT